MRERFRFGKDDYGKTLDSLGYEQIGSDAKFIFDRAIIITARTLIEFDSRAGTFSLIDEYERREPISGKWDR